MINIVGIFQKSFVQDCILFLTNKLYMLFHIRFTEKEITQRRNE